MIPLPPPDPALPGVPLALDGDAMASLFGRNFIRGDVLSCKPYYVKYKPGGYCRVQYELDVADGETTAPRLAHVSMHPATRARKLAARHELTPSTEKAHYIAELSAIAQYFPVDLALPGLAEAVDENKMARRFQRTLAQRVGSDVRGCDFELLRYKAGKRAVLKYRFDGSPIGCVYGKLRKDGGRSLLEVAGVLNRAGVPTPATLTYFSDLGMVVQAEGAGLRLKDLRNTDAYERSIPGVAEALARLHGTAVAALPHYSPETEAEELLTAAATVGKLVPHLASQAGALARRLVSMIVASGGPTCTIHGSFHDDQVLVDEQRVTFVDMDQAMLADPLIDVGHFLSYLSAEGAEDARDAFLTAYVDARGETRNDYIVFEAASLLRWATLPFRELRPDWPRAIERRVECAAERLQDARPHATIGLNRI